jgi:hypothetical protein
MRAEHPILLWLRILRGVALANLILSLAYTLPQSYAQRRVSEVQSALREQVARERSMVQAWQRWQVVLSQNRADAARVYSDRLRPRSAALPYLQERLFLLAQESGMQPKQRSWARKGVPGASRLQRLTTTMPLAGSYRQLVTFLERVETDREFLVVDQLQLARQSNSESELSVSLSAYYRTEQEGARP